MGYSVPLVFIKVSVGRTDNRQFDVAIPATRIVAMMSTDIYQARRTITAEKKAGTLINASGTEKAKTAIFLDNGAVVASPLSVRRLMTMVEKANRPSRPKKNKRMEIYAMYDPEEDGVKEEEPECEEDEEE